MEGEGKGEREEEENRRGAEVHRRTAGTGAAQRPQPLLASPAQQPSPSSRGRSLCPSFPLRGLACLSLSSLLCSPPLSRHCPSPPRCFSALG